MLQDRKEKKNRKNDRLIHHKLVYSNVKKIDSKGFKRKKKFTRVICYENVIIFKYMVQIGRFILSLHNNYYL